MRHYSLLLMVLLLLFPSACSNGGSNPVISENQTANSISNIPLIEPLISDNSFTATGLLGAYDLSINPVDLKSDLVSKRFVTVGESYIVSGTAFFTMTPCAKCLKVKSVALTADGNIQLTFYITHPFLPGDPYKPPTGRNRLDLDIFDLAMLVHPVESTPATFSLTNATAYTGVLANSSGYTTELAQVIDDNAAIPYILVIDDSISGTPTYNKFAMGAEGTFNAIFNLSGGDLNFELFLTMGYGASAKKADRLVPRYLNPEFNRKSAWKVVVTPPQGTNPPQVGNTWNDSDSTNPYNVTVKVYDWQIGANVNPDLANDTDIYSLSDVATVSAEIPGMNSTLQSVTTATSGTGTPSDPLVFTVPIANQNLLPEGEYPALVKVTDTRMPGTSTIGGETDTLVHAIDGIQTQWYEMNEFATYQTFTATVVNGCGPITGDIIVLSTFPIDDLASGSRIDFSATASSANGGDPVVLYEWDDDYDGIPAHFNPVATGQIVNLGPFINPNCPNPIPHVTYKVAVRGTDSCTPPNMTVFKTIDVVVTQCVVPSLGNITLKVNRLDVTGNFAINTSGPFTLSWTDPGGVPEFAIYVDTDPADGLTNNLVFAGTSTTASWTSPGSSFPSNHYVKGWTYIVRGRSVPGNPASEGINSEPAFVTFNGWETLSHWVNPGLGNDGEGWTVNHETSNPDSGVALMWPRINDDWASFPAQGIFACQFTPWCGYQYMAQAGRWNGILKQTPVVPNSSVRSLEFSMYLWQSMPLDGMSIGTSPSTSIHNYNPNIFDWAYAYNTGDFHPYDKESSEVQTWFNGVPLGQINCWSYFGSYLTAVHALYGGDCNIGGNPGDPYVGIEYINITGTGQVYPMIDELAIVIY